MDTMTTKVRARDRNPRLGQAYDLLHRWQVGFFNDRLTCGRSLKPMGLTAYQHRTLSALADKVNRTPFVPGLHGGTVGGEVRYHFYL
jgi:hypothetical protein